MPLKRLKQIAAIAGLLVGIRPGCAEISYTVKAPNDLVTFSSSIAANNNKDVFAVYFASYSNTGELKLDIPTSKMDTLILKRADSLSTGIIRVDSTLLDLKRMPAPVVLRGLAFQLMNSKSVLIAGSETNKLNHKLVIEDCSIYADSLETTFLSWLADNASSVEIRRSFFVSKVGKATSRISIEAGSVLFSNNLLNFAGSVTATVYQNIEISSNNINQTQFRFIGQIPVGSGVQPKISFKFNFISHPPASDAIGASGLWVLSQLGFNTLDTDVKENRLYKTWTGFDFQPGADQPLWNSTPRNLPIDPGAYGKPVSELWNWYTTSVDTISGMQSGDFHRHSKYNVLPNDPPFFSWSLPKGPLTAYFQTALFPREIRIDTSEPFPVIPQAGIRRVVPLGNSLKIGPFRLDSLSFGDTSRYGKPVLIAKDTTGLPVLQPIVGKVNDKPSSYPNNLASARYFVLANSGNTPKGANIVPGAESQVTSQEKLVFSKVDSAGFTYIVETNGATLDPDMRSLERNLGVRTTAITSGSLTFGMSPRPPPNKVSPYWPDSVYWFVPATKALIKAIPDSGRYVATAPYASGADFNAYLVEKLSVKSGETITNVAGGTLRTLSPKGFQLLVSDTATVDTTRYGNGSKGFAFTWAGRAPDDSIILSLKAGPGQQAFVITSQGIRNLDSLPDSTGNFRMVIRPEDSAKTFFVATKYNVFGGVPARGLLEGAESVSLDNFNSSTSGKLTFSNLPANFLSSQPGLDDTLLSTRLLGGKFLNEKNLKPTTPFAMTFAVNPYKDVSKVEAWTYDGSKWHPLINPVPAPKLFTGNAIPPETQIILVVERLQAPETYVTIKPVVVGNRLSVVPAFIDTLRPVTGYCIELQSVDMIGQVESDSCTVKPISDSTSLPLVANAFYSYRIHYSMGSDQITRSFQILPGTGWDPKAAFPQEFRIREKNRWYLIGFPFEAPFNGVMVRGNDVPDTKKYLDNTLLVKPGVLLNKFHYDTIPKPDTLRVKPGRAYFFASARSYTAGFDSISGLLTVRPFKLPLDTGWNFISNPYPTHLLKSRVRSNQPGKLRFYQMTYDSLAAAKKAKAYDWDNTQPALRAYEGYIYHSDRLDTLTFDPLADTATFTAKTAAGPASATLSVRLETDRGNSRMELSSDFRERNIPFLATPGSGPELRLGGQGGYLMKKVANLSSLDEPVEVRMNADGRGGFRLAFEGPEVPGAKPLQVRLIDAVSGRTYDGAAAENVPFPAGASAFRLLAGDAAFVDARTQAFLAGAPAEIGLSQNFPNPFRGRTRIALDWPAWQNGERRAVLDVLDMRGRTVSRTEIGDIRVGRQIVDLDASAWEPGLYLYRLTVVTGGRQARLQKRMLVTP